MRESPHHLLLSGRVLVGLLCRSLLDYDAISVIVTILEGQEVMHGLVSLYRPRLLLAALWVSWCLIGRVDRGAHLVASEGDVIRSWLLADLWYLL